MSDEKVAGATSTFGLDPLAMHSVYTGDVTAVWDWIRGQVPGLELPTDPPAVDTAFDGKRAALAVDSEPAIIQARSSVKIVVDAFGVVTLTGSVVLSPVAVARLAEAAETYVPMLQGMSALLGGPEAFGRAVGEGVGAAVAKAAAGPPEGEPVQ